ncbi:unnamed protein product, partial [Heterosigma akashiwo]
HIRHQQHHITIDTRRAKMEKSSREIKVFRQLKAEYARISATGASSDEILSHMKQVHETVTAAYEAPAREADGSIKKVP